jgi:hypothetical protein
MNPIDIHFKHSITSDYFKLRLYKDYTIREFCIYARERINTHFNLHNNYLIVPTGTIYNEFNMELDEDSDMNLSQYTNINNSHVFYIRIIIHPQYTLNSSSNPYNQVFEQKRCECCLDMYDNHNLNFPALPCEHNNYCSECLVTWRQRCMEQNQNYTCPECRREIVEVR